VNFVDGPVTVQVPATCANLGPGFDALGLALDLTDELSAEVVDGGLHIDVVGEGADLAPDESHLVVRAMRTAFARLDVRPPGLHLSCRNVIPHGRGLGSSAAAIVAGVALARALVPDGAERLPDAGLLALAGEIEGHPDNIAPCLLGGFTVAWTSDGVASALRLEVDSRVRPVVLVPTFTASTEMARGLLPSSVPHADAAANAARAALLVAALTREPAHLLEATDDRLHQQYRAPAMMQSFELVTSLRRQGHAAVISGAGPTVLVLSDADGVEAVRAAAPERWQVLAPGVRTARVTAER
jgi:homoserine kinase